MSYHDLDGLDKYENHPENWADDNNITRLEEGLFGMTCESVTDEEIDEWLDNEDRPRTDDNIERAITVIAMYKLGWIKHKHTPNTP